MERLLYLFSETEIFIFVFMEIITKVDTTQRVIRNQATRHDKIIFMVMFGGFSIFGTYIGITLPSGAISNIRDLGPIVAGLVAGPLIGLGVGLIGGIHRFFLGGLTSIPCGLATILAGPICGAIHNLRGNKPFSIFQGMLIAFLIECFHGGLILLIARPFAEALEVFKTVIPAMMIANSAGIAISIIIMGHHVEPKEGR